MAARREAKAKKLLRRKRRVVERLGSLNNSVRITGERTAI
jgi:hypothetical protein